MTKLLPVICLVLLQGCIINNLVATYKITEDHIPEGLGNTTLLVSEIEYDTRNKRQEKLLLKRNIELHDIMASTYDYDYIIPNLNNKDLATAIETDKDKYRFELIREVHKRQIRTMEGKTRYYLTWEYHFYDRKIHRHYPRIEEYSSLPWEVFKVILNRANNLNAKRTSP